MKAGRLDRRITIRRAGPPTDDGFTTLPGEQQVYAVRSAMWKPSRGREISESMGREAYSSGTFTVRYDNLTRGLKETDTVLYAGKVWNITSIMEVGRGEGVEIAVVAGESDDLP